MDGKQIEDGIYKVRNIIEKPKPDEVFSNIAILGRYILTPKIFHYLETQAPGAGGEIQLTDSLNRLAHDEAMYAYIYKGHRYDIGSKMGFLQANIEFGLRNPEVSDSLKEYLNQLHENIDEMLDYE